MLIKKASIVKIIGAITLFGLMLSGCGRDEQTSQIQVADAPLVQKNIYILGVHPLHNPTKLISVYAPLADYLSARIDNAEIRVEASKDYASYDAKIEQEKFDFSLPNPFQTLNSLNHNYEVINQVGSEKLFKGLILVRRDSGISQVSQLRGKRIAYPAPTALAATMMPQYFLQSQGLNLKKTKTNYVGSQESSIMNVYLKHSDASATWPIPWLDLQKKQPAVARELRVAWETDTLPNNSFMYHRIRVPEFVAKQVQMLLADLHKNEEGRQILKDMNIKRIYQADNATYKPVEAFMQKFKQKVGDNRLLAQGAK